MIHTPDPFLALSKRIRHLEDRLALIENPPPREHGKPSRSARIAMAKAIPAIAALVETAARDFRIPAWAIYGDGKTAPVVQARQWVMFEAHQAGMSSSAIGHALRRDHSTVLHGIKREAERRTA